jgi:hypothetical protein
MSRGSPENLGPARNHPKLEIIVADIAELPAFRLSLDRYSGFGPITSVWHLAANSDIPAGIADANVDLKDTFLTTFNGQEVHEEGPSGFDAADTPYFLPLDADNRLRSDCNCLWRPKQAARLMSIRR